MGPAALSKANMPGPHPLVPTIAAERIAARVVAIVTATVRPGDGRRRRSLD
jgi:hypothetical protein